jgi:hypothetical protein
MMIRAAGMISQSRTSPDLSLISGPKQATLNGVVLRASLWDFSAQLSPWERTLEANP